MADTDMNQLRERMATRVRVVRQMGQRITRAPESQIQYMEDMSNLLTGQARDAHGAATILDSQSPEAGVMERYGDALVAAKDPTTGGHEWAIIQRAMRDELSQAELASLDASEDMRTVKSASKEAALMSWTPTADVQTVDSALDRYWEAYEIQDRARTINLGEVGSTYDRSRLVTEAWTAASSGASVSERVRTRSEQVNIALEAQDSAVAEAANNLIRIDRSNGTTQTKAWDEQMGRDRSRPVTKTGPDLDMMTGHTVTRPVTDPGLDR